MDWPHRCGLGFSKLVLVAAFDLLAAALNSAHAGGPKYVAGISYFNPAVKGQPIHWAGGHLSYYVDQGPLNGAISNTQATAMVDAAAAVWSTIPTAAVQLTRQGNLAEDVSGANIVAGIGVSNGLGYSTLLEPSDVAPSATTTPVAIIFDADGAVIDSLWGSGASQPGNCERNGVLVWIDNMNPDATMAHGIIVLNGLCTTSPNLISMMSYQLEQAFGRLLGLDFAQVNDGAQNKTATEPDATLAWPIMDPLNGSCGPQGGACIPNPTSPRMDDIAALNRIYPVTAANIAGFPGKLITAANTVSIQGTIGFRSGSGMQGINVVARPLDSSGNPLYAYTVTAITGAYFGGNHGNPVTGWTDINGNRLDRFGSDAPALQGYFDLSGIPLPPGVTSANYQLAFEAVDPLYIDAISVGPYTVGSPTPSGNLATVQVNGLSAGSAQTLNIAASNSAAETSTSSIGTESAPRPMPATAVWTSRLGRVGASDWFTFPVRGNRIFTIVAQALDETGTPNAQKAMPAIGVWDGFDPIETAAAGFVPAANGFATGETWLQVATAASEIVRLGIADQRGDGRPDYLYRGWLLYADTVAPSRLPAGGGLITIRGTGFHAGDTVTVGGVAAQVVSILPTQIIASVAPIGTNLTSPSSSMDVTVNDLSGFNAIATIPGAVSYDSALGDGLALVTAPANQVPLNVPQPFTVLVKGADGNPAGGVTVLYSLTSGAATLACGQSSCTVTASGDGRATLAITATSSASAIVTASLTNGASVQAHFVGGAPANLTPLTPALYFAGTTSATPGAVVTWPVQAIVQSNASPLASQQVLWQSAAGLTAPAGPSTSNASGIASAILTVGPLAEGQSTSSTACLNSTTTCVAFQAFASRPELATLSAVSGTIQTISAAASPAPVVLRVLDTNGNPMAGGTVTISQSLYAWAPPCARRGRCAIPPLLAKKSSVLTSALDGAITLAPLTQPGTPATLIGLAATGNTSTLQFTVSQHP